MKKCALPLAEKCKPRLVDCGRADRPGMADIQLLEPLIRQIAKLRKRCAAGLKPRERLFQIVLRKIIVTRQSLVLIEFVVNLDGELIAPLMSQGHSLEYRTSILCIGERSEEHTSELQSRL